MNNLQSDWVHKLLDILLLTNTQAQGQWFGVLSLLVLVTGLSVTIFICLLLILHKYNIIEDNQVNIYNLLIYKLIRYKLLYY